MSKAFERGGAKRCFNNERPGGTPPSTKSSWRRREDNHDLRREAQLRDTREMGHQQSGTVANTSIEKRI
jgi:hypothetical protein